MKALYLLNLDAYAKIYGPAQQATIAELVDLSAPPQTAQSVATDPTILHEAEIIFSGWGMPRMDEAFLAHCPNLKAVFYGAGSIKYCTTDAFWARNIPITSSYAANAVPVAEFTLAQILLCLKKTWQHALAIKAHGSYEKRFTVPGGYGSTVGIIALGMTAVIASGGIDLSVGSTVVISAMTIGVVMAAGWPFWIGALAGSRQSARARLDGWPSRRCGEIALDTSRTSDIRNGHPPTDRRRLPWRIT